MGSSICRHAKPGIDPVCLCNLVFFILPFNSENGFPCVYFVTSKPLSHAPATTLLTQTPRFTQAILYLLWESWKTITALPSQNLNFQNPSIPQPQFRNLTHHPTARHQSTSSKFPLFLPERRVLLSFFLISYTFSYYPSLQLAQLPIDSQVTLRQLGLPSESLPNHRIQKSTLVFHAHSRPAMNTIKKKKR